MYELCLVEKSTITANIIPANYAFSKAFWREKMSFNSLPEYRNENSLDSTRKRPCTFGDIEYTKKMIAL